MPEGRLLGTALTQEFVITDPQGNARVAFQNVGGAAKVTQENSYYGYGLIMPGSVVGYSSPPNKNLYNGGSEWQNDTKAVNAGVPDYYQTFYRNYDPALARFVAVDPQAEGAESMSDYHYAGDNPVMMNDPGGNKASPYHGASLFGGESFEDQALNGGGGAVGPDPANDIGQNSDPNWMNDGNFAPNYYRFWSTVQSVAGQIIDAEDEAGITSIDFGGQFFNNMINSVQNLSQGQSLNLSIYLPSPQNISEASTGSSASSYLFSLRYDPSVSRPGVNIVVGFNDPGDIGSSFTWIQQVTKMEDDEDPSTFIDVGDTYSPFYYSDSDLQIRTNAAYIQGGGNVYGLRFGDSPTMLEDGTWQGWLSLISYNPDGSIQARQTVTYWFTSQNGQTVESSPTFYSVPTPKFTQNAIDQYNQDAPPPFLLHISP